MANPRSARTYSCQSLRRRNRRDSAAGLAPASWRGPSSFSASARSCAVRIAEGMVSVGLCKGFGLPVGPDRRCWTASLPQGLSQVVEAVLLEHCIRESAGDGESGPMVGDGLGHPTELLQAGAARVHARPSALRRPPSRAIRSIAQSALSPCSKVQEDQRYSYSPLRIRIFSSAASST